jgi:invasion protein IalB
MTNGRKISALLAVASLSGAALAQDLSLPGGASSLREAHGDWTVSCVVQAPSEGEGSKICVLSQERVAQNNQRVMAIELRPENDGVKGTLVLPFGLSLEAGVTYQLDEGDSGAQQSFRTCLPIGCLVDVNFDGHTVASLQSGRALKVWAKAYDGQEMTLSISLTGFTSALNRAAELAK